MNEMIERAAKAIFKSRYGEPEHDAFWPDRLDEIVNGPPFDAEGYRSMARAAIEAMREPTEAMIEKGVWSRSENGRYGPRDIAITIFQAMVDEAGVTR
jgi:hypothetical protein